MSEAFHGRPARRQTDVTEELREHAELADLGGLDELQMERPRGLVIRFRRDVRLCSNPAGTQLYLVGGNQRVDDLKPFKVDETKDSILLGPVKSVTYFTAKQHLGKADKKPGPYVHQFGEDGGSQPHLVYDRINHLLSFTGGSYRIERDMAGGFSAGIKD